MMGRSWLNTQNPNGFATEYIYTNEYDKYYFKRMSKSYIQIIKFLILLRTFLINQFFLNRTTSLSLLKIQHCAR